VIQAYPEVERWIVGGHSLGGVAAANFAGTASRVDGLLLWASYPSSSTDLSGEEDLEVTSIRGRQDGLLGTQSFEQAQDRLPASTAYIEVEGANHAYFGDYGAQSGDGEATVSREEARGEIVSASSAMIERVRSKGLQSSAETGFQTP
jgi:dienelactone hydrolase